MVEVRQPLMKDVYSELDDCAAAESLRDTVKAHPHAAEATLRYVTRTRRRYPGYITDRARRILVAAMQGRAPAAVDASCAELYRRERELGEMALAEAFDEICRAVPELRSLVYELAHATQRRDGSAMRSLEARVRRCVGPDARHPDALVRSPLARQVVARYLSVLEGRAYARDPPAGLEL